MRSGQPLKGAEVVVVGRSNIVGKPIAAMLMQKSPTGNATVTVCHTGTKDIAAHTRRADIVIAAVGVKEYITGDMIKDGAVIIDVGVNEVMPRHLHLPLLIATSVPSLRRARKDGARQQPLMKSATD